MTTLLLSACTSSSSPTPPAGGSGGSYLQVLRARDPYFDTVSDATLFRVATGLCSEMDRGADLNDMTVGAVGLDATPEQVGMLLAFAVRARCPQNEDVLTQSYRHLDAGAAVPEGSRPTAFPDSPRLG